MGNWLLVKSTSLGTSDISFYNAIGYPKVYSGLLYGVPSRPYYKLQYDYDFIQSRWKVYYDNSNSFDTIYGSVRPAWVESTYYFKTPVSISAKGVDVYESVQITGKFRLRDTAEGLLRNTFIQVNFLLNGEEYNFIGNSNNGSRGTPTEPSYYTCFGKIGSEGVNSVVSLQTGSSAIVTNYRNSIIDFGTANQEIPSFLYNWIITNTDPIYPNSVTIKSQDGTEELSKVIELPTLVNGTLNILGNTKTLVLTGDNNKDYTITWDSKTPEGKQFTGLSFSPNSRVPNIPLDIYTEFNLVGDVILYECYSNYRPPATTFSVVLYKNSAEANRVDKTDYLTAVGSLNGVMREGSSITDLSITFEMDTLPQFNYVHIPAFNRYYYVTDISTIKYRLWEMDLEVDVLMSYKDAILSCYAFVDRNEFSTNEFLPDKKRVIEEGVDVQVLEGNRNLFNTNINSGGWMYVLNGYNIGTAYVEPPEEE